MTNIFVNSNCLVITSELTVSYYSFHTTEVREINLQSSSQDCTKNGGNVGEKSFSESIILTANLSRCGNLLALCDATKQLSVWEVCSWSCRKKWHLAKRASKVKFTPNGRAVLVADKSGDLYQFYLDENDDKGRLLLGHLSMLLDIVVTPDEKHIISCDRDEKIRVSKYPNTYNIVSYCLGHKEFVTCIDLVSHSLVHLVSSSGDGTIRLWHFISGKQLQVITCSTALQNIRSENSNPVTGTKCMMQSKLSDDGESRSSANDIIYDESAVKNISVGKYNENTSILCACVHNLNGCLVYKIIGNENINIVLLEILDLSSEPCSILYSTHHLLWILSTVNENPLSVFNFDQNENMCPLLSYSERDDHNIKAVVSLVNKTWDHSKTMHSQCIVSSLYKRKYDSSNVNEEKRTKFSNEK